MSKVLGKDRRELSGVETFFLAMEQGNVRLARFVLDALDGSIVNTRVEGGRTLLMCATLLPAAGRALCFAKLLLGKNAAVNSQDDEGRTALSHACQWGDIDVVRLLVQSNADPEIVDRWGNSSLIYGAWSGQAAVVDFLVRSFKRLGLDINRTNAFGQSALDVAESLGHQDCAQVLAGHGRRRHNREPSSLEDLTFKRNPHGQSQGPWGSGKERRVQEWFLVPRGKTKPVLAYNPMQGNGGPITKPIQPHCRPQENRQDFPKAVSDTDAEYLFDPPAWQQDSCPGLGMNDQESSLRPVISIDWDRKSQITARPSEGKLNPTLVKALRTSLKPVAASSLDGGHVQCKTKGGQLREAWDVSRDAENRLLQGYTAEKPRDQETLPQDWCTRCRDGLAPQCHGGHSGIPPGRQKASGPLKPQLNRKGSRKVAPMLRSFREGSVAPVTSERTPKSPDVLVGSIGNPQSQGKFSRKFPPLDSVPGTCWRCGQEDTPLWQRMVLLPPIASPSTQHLRGPTAIGETEDRRSEAQTVSDELETSLRLSDCKLEGLLGTDDGHSLLGGVSLAKTYLTLSAMHFFRRPTMPQLRTLTERLGDGDSGGQLPRSKTFPNYWQTVRIGNKLGVGRGGP